jgi:predicted Zn-dependent protease
VRSRLTIALTLLSATALAAPNSQLPDFGNPADAVLSKSREAQIGRAVMLQLRSADAILNDPSLTEYIGVLGARLAAHATDGDRRFQFFVVNDDRINAFALPGGYIGINSGLILATENESELASVIAHEISHVTQRHIARAAYDNQRNSIVSMAAMLGAILLGAASNVNGRAMEGVMAASQAAAAQHQINFTRANEREADRVGMEVLASSGFDPEAMASFFEKLSRRYGTAERQVPELLQTHPVTTERIAQARSRARQLPPAHPTDSVGYGLAKARLRVLTSATPQEALKYFKARPDQATPAIRYGEALSLMGLSQNDHAEQTFRELSKEAPGVIAYRIGRAEALMASGLTKQALAVYADAIGLFPRNVPLTTSYAQALITAGKPGEAHRVLLDLLNNVPPTPEQIRLIARAANAEGDVGNAYYYMAEYYVSIGDLQLALNQLGMALEAPGVQDVDRARFQARLAELRGYLPDKRHERSADDDTP